MPIKNPDASLEVQQELGLPLPEAESREILLRRILKNVEGLCAECGKAEAAAIERQEKIRDLIGETIERDPYEVRFMQIMRYCRNAIATVNKQSKDDDLASPGEVDAAVRFFSAVSVIFIRKLNAEKRGLEDIYGYANHIKSDSRRYTKEYYSKLPEDFKLAEIFPDDPEHNRDAVASVIENVINAMREMRLKKTRAPDPLEEFEQAAKTLLQIFKTVEKKVVQAEQEQRYATVNRRAVKAAEVKKEAAEEAAAVPAAQFVHDVMSKWARQIPPTKKMINALRSDVTVISSYLNKPIDNYSTEVMGRLVAAIRRLKAVAMVSAEFMGQKTPEIYNAAIKMIRFQPGYIGQETDQLEDLASMELHRGSKKSNCTKVREAARSFIVAVAQEAKEAAKSGAETKQPKPREH